MIDKQRLQENFFAMKKFSLPGEGITRLAFSDEDWQARDFIMKKMQAANLAVREDAFGNIFGRRQGSNPALPPVTLGSHIDSVPEGGNFDGVAGTLAALEVLTAMQEDDFLNEHPVEMIVFMAEESSRFGLATIGSKVMTGQIDAQKLKTLKDKQGTSLYDILKERGLEPDAIDSANFKERPKVFLEMHIEQGKVLEAMKKKIGVVTGIAAPTRIKAILHGHADHSGATPMGLRHDGLCAAAEIILQVEQLAATTQKPCVGTVGIVQVSPNVMNVIPGDVELGIDLRSIYDDEKTALAKKVQQSIQNIAHKRDLIVEIIILADDRPVKLGNEIIDFLSDICEAEDIEYMQMPSGAGHDAMHMAQLCPTGMLFIPCKEGISHHKNEYATIEDIALGTQILYKAICELSKTTCQI